MYGRYLKCHQLRYIFSQRHHQSYSAIGFILIGRSRSSLHSRYSAKLRVRWRHRYFLVKPRHSRQCCHFLFAIIMGKQWNRKEIIQLDVVEKFRTGCMQIKRQDPRSSCFHQHIGTALAAGSAHALAVRSCRICVIRQNTLMVFALARFMASIMISNSK